MEGAHHFLHKRKEESAILQSGAIREKILHDPESLSDTELEEALEKFETKIFTYTNPNANTDAKRILLEGSQPYSFGLISELLKELVHNSQCKEVTVIAEGVTAEKIAALQDDTLTFNESTTDSILTDIGEIPTDICLVFMEEPENSPLLPLLYSAKSVIGAEKLFVYFNGPYLQSNFKERFSTEKRKNMDEIDGAITNTDLGAAVVKGELGLPDEKVFVTDNLSINEIARQPKEKLRTEGRRKLGLGDEEITLLYLGFPSKPTESIGMDPDLNVRTFEETASGALLAATQNSDKSFAVIVRAHPRDPHKDEMFNVIPTETPDNLRFIIDNQLTYEEAVYAADGIISSPLSTEISLASYRGRSSLICAFEGKGLTADLLHNSYSSTLIEQIKSTNASSFIDSKESLAIIFADLKPFEPKEITNRNEDSQSVAEILLS